MRRRVLRADGHMSCVIHDDGRNARLSRGLVVTNRLNFYNNLSVHDAVTGARTGLLQRGVHIDMWSGAMVEYDAVNDTKFHIECIPHDEFRYGVLVLSDNFKDALPEEHVLRFDVDVPQAVEREHKVRL